MSQSPRVFTVTIASAGTPQRVITNPLDPYATVKSAAFSPPADNTGNIYVGGDNVSDSVFALLLSGSEGDTGSLVGDTVFDSRGNHLNYIDLYNTWVDADSSSDSVNVAVLI